MAIFIQRTPNAVGPLPTLWVQTGSGSVRPVRRIYHLASITVTYPNGPAGGPVYVPNWESIGDYEAPWLTPDVPTLTSNPPQALSFHETKVTLQSYQDNGDKKEWSRVVEYVDADTGVWRGEEGLGTHELSAIRSWPEPQTRVKARACFQSNTGRGAWSAFSNTVTTTETGPG